MGEGGQWATSEMGTRNRSGIEGTSIPQRLYEHLKAKAGTPRSALGLGKSREGDQIGEGEEEAPTCCVYSRVTSQKNRSCHTPKERERA